MPENAKDAIREMVREMFPTIPLPEQEEVTDQTIEVVQKYGVVRAMTIGEVVVRLVEGACGRDKQ